MTPPQHIVAACALVTNDSGEILLVETERRGWELPGGQVEVGETLTQALVREIEEESGVVAAIDDLRLINSNLSRPILIFGFRAHALSGHLRPQPSETRDVRWVLPDDVLSMVTHPPGRQRAEDLLAADTPVLYRAYTVDPYTLVESRFVTADEST